MKRILYSGSVHDQDEKDAVMAVLDGGVSSFALGENVAGMERQVAALFGKTSGIMVNSGSSALYLAVELLNLPAGSEVITSTTKTRAAFITRFSAFGELVSDVLRVEVRLPRPLGDLPTRRA